MRVARHMQIEHTALPSFVPQTSAWWRVDDTGSAEALTPPCTSIFQSTGLIHLDPLCACADTCMVDGDEPKSTLQMCRLVDKGSWEVRGPRSTLHTYRHGHSDTFPGKMIGDIGDSGLRVCEGTSETQGHIL